MTLCILLAGLFHASPSTSILNEPALGGQPQSARSIGMGGAQRAIADSAEGVFLNPAGLAASKKYLIEGNYAWSQDANAHKPMLTVVDSQTTAVAAGAAYGYEKRINQGSTEIHRIHFGLAYNISFFSIGATLKYMSSNRLRVSSDVVPPQNGTYVGFNTDVGVMIQPIQYFSIGVVGYNLVANREENRELQPFALGIGAAAHIFGLELGADAVLDFMTRGKTETRWHFGAEYAIANIIPLRAGFIYDRIGGDMFWSIGGGFQYQSFGIDVGYRQAVANTRNRTMSVGIRISLN